MLDTVRKEAVYPFPPERVWVALTDPRALAEWLMPNNFKPEVGHKFVFQVDPMPGCGHTTECEVLAVEPPKRLVYSWRPVIKLADVTLEREGDGTAVRRSGPQLTSTVSWTLYPQGGGTRLVLEHSGLTGVHPWWQRFMLRFGWGTMLKRLIPKVTENVSADGLFTPGAIPLNKRCYKCETILDYLVR